MAKSTTQSVSRKSAPPTDLQPMLATLVDKPFDDENWIFEIKWDGYRAITTLYNGDVELSSRNSKSFNEKFYPFYEEMKTWKLNAVLDGEILVVDSSGKADFNALQRWRSETDGHLIYYVFDLLWLNGKSLLDEPLSERRKLLREHLPESNLILYSDDLEANGIDFFHTAEKMKLEGIMAKRKDSPYLPGNRTRDWLKIKTQLRQEVVIGGYTVNEGSSKQFSSLLVGVYQGTNFIYTGKVGTGFTQKKQKELMELFAPLVISDSPFTITPDVNQPSRFRPNPPHAEAIWLKPQLVCEITYRELTPDGVMRHPSFKGMREDKKAMDVSLETEESVDKTTKSKRAEKLIKSPVQKASVTLLNPTEKTQVKKVKGKELKFTNLDKIYWPGEGITKRDMINYYHNISQFILPYLKNRPQSLNRFPNGIDGKSFYQKNMRGKVPEWVETVPYMSEGKKKEFMLCNSEATLLYMANLGCIEFNPWSSTVKKPDNPDFCIIDLDPDQNTFEDVIEVAQVTHKILAAADIDSYCKTSGSTGIHIYIPLGAKYTYEESKEFGRVIATMVHAELPAITSIERQRVNRGGKLYVDFLQNRPNATVAAPYSLRPKPGATVSMPLHWEEVKKGLKMADFTIHNAVKRAQETADIFKPVLGKGIKIEKALEKLSSLL